MAWPNLRRSDRSCPALAGSGWSNPPLPRIWTGWAGTPTRTSSCCGRCRARPTPTTRCARWCGWPTRLGRDWDELNQALVKDRGLRGRLFGVLGSSLALGDHLVANPDSWHLLAGGVTLPSADELRDSIRRASAEKATDTTAAVQPLRKLYRDRLLVLAGLDLAPTVENEPVLPFATVGEHLSDLADAALGAALTVATRVGLRGRRRAPADRGDRDGQVRRARAELRQRRRRHLRRRQRGRDRNPGGRRDDAVRGRHVLRGRRRAATGGQARPAGAHAGLPHRLLPAVGQDVGVPGADEGAARRRRRRTGQAVHRGADADGVDGQRA